MNSTLITGLILLALGFALYISAAYGKCVTLIAYFIIMLCGSIALWVYLTTQVMG